MSIEFRDGYKACFELLTRAVDAVLFDANRDKEVVPFEVVAAISDRMKELKPNVD